MLGNWIYAYEDSGGSRDVIAVKWVSRTIMQDSHGSRVVSGFMIFISLNIYYKIISSPLNHDKYLIDHKYQFQCRSALIHKNATDKIQALY